MIHVQRKFAKISYLDDIGQIPVKYNVIKDKQDILTDWYVKKYNPFKLEDISLFSQEGYMVKLPLTKDNALADMQKTEAILKKTVDSLTDYDVVIFLPPRELRGIMPPDVRIADGLSLVPFFIVKAAIKALKILNKHIRDCEFVIIGDNECLIESFMDAMYCEVNFLTVLMQSEPTDDLFDKAEDIFFDTGLDIRFVKPSKAYVSSADIIINISDESYNFDYAFKRNAVYFDLSRESFFNDNRLQTIINNRRDMIIIDGLRLTGLGLSLPLCDFELAFYLKNSDYRIFLKRKYDINTAWKVYESIQKMRMAVSGFYRLGSVISSSKK